MELKFNYVIDVDHRYIRMCKNATKICGKQFGYKSGQYCYIEKARGVKKILLISESNTNLLPANVIFHCLVATQTDIQNHLIQFDLNNKMTPTSPLAHLAMLSKWLFKDNPKVWHGISYEEIWLMYAMKMLYNQEWNQQANMWVDIEESDTADDEGE